MAGIILTGVFLGICTVTDIREKAVNLWVILVFLISGAALVPFSGTGAEEVILGLIPGALLLLLSFVTKGAVGTGDGLALAVTGILLGPLWNLKLFMTALFLTAVFSAVLLIIRKCGRDSELPFLPFLFVSFLLTSVGKAADLIGGRF